MAPTRIEYPDSPDPLADSLIEEYASHSSPRKGVASNTNRAGQRRRKSSDITVKSSELITDQGTSPWRIKVTVEAEHEEADVDMESGTGRRQTIIRTVKVPLRDTSSPSKNLRQTDYATRSKDRDESASSARKSRTRRKSVTNLNAVVLGDDTEEDEWTATPRSPGKKRNNKNKGIRKSIDASQRSVLDTFEVREDESNVDSNDRARTHSREATTAEMREVDINEVALRAKSSSIKQNNGRDHGKEDVRKISLNSAMSYPTPSPTSSEYACSEEVPRNPSNDNEIGLDTVMESEGFTMIDLESLPSVKHMRNTPEYPTISEEPDEEPVGMDSTVGNKQEAIEAPSIHLSTLAEDITDISSDLVSSPPEGGKKKVYSIGHLQLPSSTNVYRHRHVTPMPQTSPSLPSPPRAPASVTKERSPANSDKAVVAGLVLQDAVTPEHSFLSDQQDNGLGNQEEEPLFGGFSPATQRELRAELRFGEELGKKQFSRQEGFRDIPNKELQDASLARLQVWRGETIVQHTPPITTGMDKHVFGEHTNENSSNSSKISKTSPVVTADKTRWEARARREREKVIENAKAAGKDDVLVIESDSDSGAEDISEEDGEPDETMGDIWLAEARNHSSSPRDVIQEQVPSSPREKPKRKLIPSPWKRGERIDLNATSQLSGNDSFTGIFSKESAKVSSGGFGAAIVANPDKIPKHGSSYDRRRSGEFLDGGAVSRQTRRLSPRRDGDDDDDQDIDDENFDGVRDFSQWRDASDVVEEETELLEAEHQLGVDEDTPVDGPVGATTRLYETNLDNLSDQDLSSSPHIQLFKKHQVTTGEHDSTYSSLSEQSTEEELYRQRTSLSPSKHRPNTPRSALKGGRNSFGAALVYNNPEIQLDPTDKKVVWAKRMSCMNEEWEESSRSIRSTQESFQDDTPTPLTVEKPMSQERERRQHENPFVVDPQPATQEQSGRGWFSWFKQADNSGKSQEGVQKSEQNGKSQSNQVANLDGSIDEFITNDYDPERDDSSYAPTSRHTSVPRDTITTRKTQTSRPTNSTYSQKPNHQHISKPQKQPSRSQANLPSYLLAPSYPSDPTRDPTIPLPTSGPFTPQHFKTLHIIYRKSQRPRFHGPHYPSEIRLSLLSLVERKWMMSVDETETMDEVFEFRVGERELRVLERFMREVEWGYAESGKDMEWGWSVEELAEKLGRIAVGEVVRGEEKEAAKILRGKK